MLSLRNVTAHYGTSQALFDISLDVAEGQVVTLLGRNGMGKTTTVNAIMGIVRASGGSIRFEGQELVGRPSFRTANLGLGLVPEGRQIFPNLTLWENLVATVEESWQTTNHFFKYFDAETGEGLGSDHQTGWTALVANLIDERWASSE